jgi:hypothetical protein
MDGRCSPRPPSEITNAVAGWLVTRQLLTFGRGHDAVRLVDINAVIADFEYLQAGRSDIEVSTVLDSSLGKVHADPTP